jgi:predicted nucleotide-binding protein
VRRITSLAVELRRRYERTRFADTVLAEAVQEMRQNRATDREIRSTWTVRLGDDDWTFDGEDEFFSAYRDGWEEAVVDVFFDGDSRLRITAYRSATDVIVAAPTRADIAKVVAVFDRAREAYYVPPAPTPPPPTPVVFIGHGGSAQWRALKDHLTDQHGIEVEAYEVGARAGHHIRDVLESMVNASTMAFLVMTAEDTQQDSNVRPRQNVVHELGLFQGSLGFSRAIAVAENGTELFSNLDGVQQLRFSPDNIREVFGDVLATIRREFPGAL